MSERFALYYAPAMDDPLWRKAAQWLGRDPAGGAVAAVEIAGIDTGYRHTISQSARRYGFHATLKAPMALAPGVTRARLEAGLCEFVARQGPVSIGKLVPRFISGFLALVPANQTRELTDFAGAVVQELDPLRAPLRKADREKRLKNGSLTPRQVELLDQYGYPYVMDEFRFHMTLTDRLPEPDRHNVLVAAEKWFGPAIEEPFMLDRIALFHEPETGAPFARLADFELGKVRADA